MRALLTRSYCLVSYSSYPRAYFISCDFHQCRFCGVQKNSTVKQYRFYLLEFWTKLKTNAKKKKKFLYIRYIFNYVLDKIFIIIIVRKREQFLQKLFGIFLYRIFYRELLY